MSRRQSKNRAPRVNDRCPCGSGKKYKHCHGASQQATVSTTTLLGMARNASAAGRLPAAQTAYLSVLDQDPSNFDALWGMAEIAERAGDLEVAGHYHSRLSKEHSHEARVFFARGNFFVRQYDFARAQSNYRRALDLDPMVAGAWINLGNVEKYLGNLREAIACYDKAVACDPENAAFHSNSLISLYYDASTSHEEMFARHKAWADQHAARFYPHGRTWRNSCDPDRRLRLGYVSEGFDSRVLGHFVRNVFLHHDRKQVVTYAYSGTRCADELTTELRPSFDYWREIRKQNDNAVVQQIERDEIDILVDLDGHTPDTRLLVFARKPAPVAITWLGYWNTTGMSTVDYILTDPLTTPRGSPQRFTERPLFLPDSRFLYAPVPYAPKVSQLPSTEGSIFTFGSFNRFDKLGPELIDCWAEIMRRVPRSRLVIKNSAIAFPHARKELSRRFKSLGIEPERIDLRAKSPHAAMLAQYNDIDLGLDTFPYNGGLTTCEALWMGVPIVAIEEERMISRQTSSMLRLVGCEDFVAQTRDEYVDLAVHWANQIKKLAIVRACLREKMRASPLCDGARFTQNLEAAMRNVWRHYCSSRQ